MYILYTLHSERPCQSPRSEPMAGSGRHQCGPAIPPGSQPTSHPRKWGGHDRTRGSPVPSRCVTMTHVGGDWGAIVTGDRLAALYSRQPPAVSHSQPPVPPPTAASGGSRPPPPADSSSARLHTAAASAMKVSVHLTAADAGVTPPPLPARGKSIYQTIPR